MTIEIKHRLSGGILFTSDKSTVKGAVIDAYLGGADLGGADLGGADLRDANLRGANLRGANLRDAYLGGADLGVAYLGGAYLRDAYLGGADLRGADVIHCGDRSDGYGFFAHIREDKIWIIAGCRYFNITDAAKHWKVTRDGTQLGNESQQILKNARALVKIRGLK